MKSNIFIPEKINVGFRNRDDTYTKKLAYVIYFDHKGVLRKEISWNSWRDKSIDSVIYENVPTSGFVLNKKAGGYSTGWNHRQTYVRVYDPRGFEFEIDIPNLLYILENTSSIKGKGLDGEFVYGWDGKELVLIPTDSPDYKEITSFNEKIHNQVKIKGKDLKLGGTYLTRDNLEYVYLGRFDVWDYDYISSNKVWKTKGKGYYFYNKSSKYKGIELVKSLSAKIIDTVSEDCVEDYAELMEKLERNTNYSPIDDSKDEYVPYTLDEFLNKLQDRRWLYCYNNNREEVEVSTYRDKPSFQFRTRSGYYDYSIARTQEFNSLEELYNALQPTYKNVYLANGKLYQEGK